jgi:hypothetical protein
MKNFVKLIVGSLALTMPMVSSAQVATNVSVAISNANTFRTGATGYNGTGGGYLSTFTVDLGKGTRTFTDYLLWCIDGGRSVAPPNIYAFDFYTADQFAATSFGSKNGHDLDDGDVNSIASLTTDVVENWGMLGNTAKKNYQGSIWSEFDGYTTYNNVGGPILAGNRSFNTRDYYVLYNGRNQTFMTYIPEPSSVVLMMAGMAGLLVVTRRRNNHA